MARDQRTGSGVVVAIESWTCNDQHGNAVMVHRGSRWRSDDPIREAPPDLFVEDGSTDGEIMRAREAAGIANY